MTPRRIRAYREFKVLLEEASGRTGGADRRLSMARSGRMRLWRTDARHRVVGTQDHALSKVLAVARRLQALTAFHCTQPQLA